MIYRKYDPQKRKGVIICPEEMEGLTNLKADAGNIITILSDKYRDSSFELPPYHYIVSEDGIVPIKSLNLQHGDISHLRAFNDDIKVLLLDNKFLFTREDELSKLISDMSNIYYFKISVGTIFAKADASIDQESQMNKIIKQAIRIRNASNPIMTVCESIVDDEIIVNDKIATVNNRWCFSSLSQFADQYSVPLSVLNTLNPHLKERQLVVDDVIFIPNTIAHKGIELATSYRKHATYLYDRATKIIEGVI